MTPKDTQEIGSEDVGKLGAVLTGNTDAEGEEGAAVEGNTLTCKACGEPVELTEAIKTPDGAYHPEHFAPGPTVTCPECGHSFQHVIPGASA
jgi:hypothetical protein